MLTTEISSDTENIIPFPNTMNTKVEYHPTVHDLPTDERPRERLQNHGPQALSNAELLAIILRTGTTRNNVISPPPAGIPCLRYREEAVEGWTAPLPRRCSFSATRKERNATQVRTRHSLILAPWVSRLLLR
jgi:hypothetical protein